MLMSGGRRRDAPANMATLDVCLIMIMCICRIYAAVVKTNASNLEHMIKEKLSVADMVYRGTEAGVAMFHQYQDCHVSASGEEGHILHTVRQNDHIENFTLKFEAFGKRFLLDLHLTRNLFSSSYTRKVLHGKGADLKESLHRKEHCYYQGQLRSKPSSHAAISSCNGFRGYFSVGEETYHIEPVNGTTHRIFRNADRKKLPFKCGTGRHDTFHAPTHIFSQHSRKKRSIHGPYDANKFTRFVELYIVNDYRTFDRHGKNADAVFKRTQDIANIVNSLYRQLNIYIVLVGVEVWSTGDKISITRSADTTMENFLRYRKERINPYHVNDNAQLITGILFDHGVVGKAIKGPICTHQFSGGVSMDYDGLVTLVATTMAHEMGHNFGMEHDNDTKCGCPEDKCIMAATSGQFSPQHWSSCSQNALHEAFELGMDYCLRNPPTTIFDGPVCGNGLVEEGEECDCGLPEDCTNRCCNASACMLFSLAECGTGQCCDLTTCKPKKPATLCREPIGECDLPEYCDGASEYCPSDVHIQDGQTCADDQSYCYKGQCNTHSGQCQLLWGDTGRVSDPICFQQLNPRGNHDGNCGYNWTTDHYKTCERENVMCGLLHCVHLNEKLMFWRDNLALDMQASFLTRGNTQYVCRSTMLDVGLDMPDPGLVPDGAKCEENKICIKQTCTPLIKLKTLKCPDCNNNGVCNNAGNCHCHVGYAPPLCDRPGYGGSLDSGPASNEYAKRDLLIGLLVLFLVVLPLVTLAFLAYINRERLRACWKLGPRIKFGVLKKNPSAPPPPQPRLSNSFSDKRWSSAPSKPNTTLEISGPLLEDPPEYDDYVGERTPVPNAPSRPIFKPSANKPSVIAPKQNRPLSQQGLSPAPVAAIPTVAIAGRDSRKVSDNRSVVHPPPAADGAPTGVITTETNRPSRVLHFSDSTLKRQQKEKEAVKTADPPTQNVPASPTKGGKKLLHSHSLRGADDSAGREKLVKRTSFRGTEISSPILVSTTNRDSQVFADLELDQSGVIARPVGKQYSFHAPNPASEGAADGCRNPVRRSQSDRPLSPTRPDAAGSLADKKSTTLPGSSFNPRPLPPEPVDEDEPLYANEGLSNLDDLKAQISSAFEGFSLGPEDGDNSTDAKPKDSMGSAPKIASKPVAPVLNSVLKKDSLKTSTPSSAPSASQSSSKPAHSSSANLVKPSSLSDSTASKFGPRSDAASSKPQSFSSKSSALERILNNQMKKPAGFSSEAAPTSSLSNSTGSKDPGKVCAPWSSSAVSKPAVTGGSDSAGVQPSTTTASSSGPSVRGPFGSAMLKGSSLTDGGASVSNPTPTSKPSLANKGPLSALLNTNSKISSHTPDAKPSATATANKGLLSNKASLPTAVSSAGDTKTSTITPAGKPSATTAAQKGPLSGKGPLSAGSRSSTDTKTSTSNPAIKPSAIAATQRGPLAGKGPLSSAQKPGSDTKISSQTPTTKPSTAASTNKGPQSSAATRTSSAPNTASKGLSKGPSAAAVNRSSSSSNPTTVNKPASANKFSASSAPSKGTDASTTSKSSASSVPSKGTDSNKASASSSSSTRGLTAAHNPKVSSTGSASATRGQNASGVNRSGYGANRPALAPKPGAAKAVRSFNF